MLIQQLLFDFCYGKNCLRLDLTMIFRYIKNKDIFMSNIAVKHLTLKHVIVKQ